MKTITRFLLLGLVSITCSFASAQSSGSAEKDCMSFIQGKMAWDYAGNTSWSTENLKRLCAGTHEPEAPGRCFSHVMNGGVNWGGGTRWEWKNALELCAGTDDPKAPVSCFENSVAKGQNWKDAIAQCAVKGMKPGTLVLPDSASNQTFPKELLPPQGLQVSQTLSVKTSCEEYKDVACGVFIVNHTACAVACFADPCSNACRGCIERAFTAGIDCWRCLFASTCSGSGGIGGGTITGTKICGECRPIAPKSNRGFRACSFYKGTELITSGTEACTAFTQE